MQCDVYCPSQVTIAGWAELCYVKKKKVEWLQTHENDAVPRRAHEY